MDKLNRNTMIRDKISNRAIDGLIYGLVSGVAMYLSMALLTLFMGEAPGDLLERFGIGGLTSPIQGLVSHLAVSAIYGIVFGALLWPLFKLFNTAKILNWLGGLSFSAVLLLLAQIAILPGTGSPLAQVPFWQWALGHGIYGLVLGGLFARTAA